MSENRNSSLGGDGLVHAAPSSYSFRRAPEDRGFENLSIGIIRDAAFDYIATIKALYSEKDPLKLLKLLTVKSEIERFFFGDWYASLTNVDPAYLVPRIREMARKEILDELKDKYKPDDEVAVEKITKRKRKRI